MAPMSNLHSTAWSYSLSRDIHTAAPGLSPPFHHSPDHHNHFSASFSHSLRQADFSRGSRHRDSILTLPLEAPASPCPASPSIPFTHISSHDPVGDPPHPSLQQDHWPIPAGAVRYWTLPHTPGPGPPDPCPCFAFLGRISLEIMTLQPRCEDVETAEGVALTVTGVAQV